MVHLRNDYGSAAHPAVLKALAAAADEAHAGYGDDVHSKQAAAQIRALCGAPDAAVHFVPGGTAANLIALAGFLRPWEAVIAPAMGHINVHEGGAIEAAGHKILTPDAPDGKLTPVCIDPMLRACRADSAQVWPRLVYLSNATEMGLTYTKAELTALAAYCRGEDLLLFLDGARLAAALTSDGNDLALPDVAALCDAFYLGGTKNGALFGEALVIANPALQAHFFRAMKQRGGVLAKGFLLGIQFEALLKDGLYFEIAREQNRLAGLLRAGLEALGLSFANGSRTNQIFPIVPNERLPRLREFCTFEVWAAYDDARTVIRLVTGFSTIEDEIYAVLAGLH